MLVSGVIVAEAQVFVSNVKASSYLAVILVFVMQALA